MGSSMAERSVMRHDIGTTGGLGALWRWLGVMVLATLLAACATVVPRTEAPVEVPPPVQANPDSGLPVDTQRHRIALLVPQTGADAAVGMAIANATTMALLDSRSDRIRITTYDTATGAAAAAQAAINDGNRLILGPLLSDDVRAVQPIARAANVPLISFSNDSSVAGNGTFLLGFEPGQAVNRVVAHARAAGSSRFAALVPRSVYGERAVAAMRTSVTAAGGTLVSTEFYDRSATGLSGAIRRLTRAEVGGIDAVLIADGGQTAIRAVPLIRSGGAARARILGTELWNTEAALGGSAPMRGAWFASVSDTLYGQLATRYRERYGLAPYRLSSLGYDAVLLTIRVARDWRPGTVFPQARLFQADGFGGIDGIFRFDNRGIAVRALEVSEVRAGGFAVVDAAPTRW
jgi:branched-chain amino acid transport system substrate-binding protein